MMSWVEVACASAHQIRHPRRDLTHFVISAMKGPGFFPWDRQILFRDTRMAPQKHFFGLVLFMCAHAIYTDVGFTCVWDGGGGTRVWDGGGG